MSNAISTTPQPRNEPVKQYAAGSAERTELKNELKRQSSSVVEIPLNGGGSGGFEGVFSPQKHQHKLAECQKAGSDDIAKAISKALAVRKEWAALPWEERAAVFLKAADLLATKYRPILNASTMLGQSKTSHQAEIDAACELIDFFRFNVKYMEQIYAIQPESSPGMWNRSSARGLEGFVFAVTPFNFTSIAINLPCAPALMGCTVLWKPAMSSVLSSYYGVKLLEEAGLPDGVINFVPSDPQVISSQVLAHPELSGIHFTGSTNTFNYFWSEIGKNISKYRTYPRIVGETGGKDFVFVHPSADTDEVVTALVRGSFEFQGQKCSASSRAYIPRSLWSGIKERLVSITNDIKMGDPEDFTNFMGAVIDKKAYVRIKSYIDEAKNHANAKIIAGGQCDDSVGYFIRPTIIETTDPRYRSMTEEIFGPVLTIFVYDDNKIEEALEACDTATPYALTGAIFAKDRRVIHKLAQRLEHAAGNFYINDKPTGAVVGQQPFGGSRASGTNDKAGSMLNLLRWTSMRTIKENFQPITDYKYPFMSAP